MRYTVTQSEDGKTVKEILLGSIGLSVAFLKHLKFMENGIMLDGEKVTVRRVVHAGDILCLATENEKLGSRLTPTELPLEIVYEDEDLVVPSKSADMPTHPSHNHHGDTLADALAYYYKDAPEPFVFRPINRLDRNTSGLTLIAKNRISAARLAASMRDGKIKKQYVAILDGILPDDRGSIETYLRRTGESIIVREVCDENGGGDYALTHYEVIARSDRYTLVLASPETGRTHQLRVHFASLGCAILGDDMYGEVSPIIPRHALHALSLSFPHPSKDETVTCTSLPPEDMAGVIRAEFGEETLYGLSSITTFS
ncbi:MAG: RluA family pseudouridine synthase [Clostridia bacterium]|nr:RluA family pseudouridine synthase [Clostridia bacterium]